MGRICATRIAVDVNLVSPNQIRHKHVASGRRPRCAAQALLSFVLRSRSSTDLQLSDVFPSFLCFLLLLCCSGLTLTIFLLLAGLALLLCLFDVIFFQSHRPTRYLHLFRLP